MRHRGSYGGLLVFDGTVAHFASLLKGSQFALLLRRIYKNVSTSHT